LRACNEDAACLRQRRIDVSAAFFGAQEFQDTGFFVYRLYKAAFAVAPTYLEFNVARGLIVDGDYKEVNKQNYVESFVSQATFQARYPSTLTNEAFVDRILNSAEIYFAPLDRQRFIDQLAGGATRADVLRQLIELPLFKNREYNRAFVLMQYFGYLQRDADQYGYNFWVNVLANQPTNYASMVCAFVSSAEYQMRFSPVVSRNNGECAGVSSSVVGGYQEKGSPITDDDSVEVE